MFDKEWHKVHFGVHRERVVLYVDCEFSEELPLDVRGPIDVNGEIAISKVAGTRRTVPVRRILLKILSNIHSFETPYFPLDGTSVDGYEL